LLTTFLPFVVVIGHGESTVQPDYRTTTQTKRPGIIIDQTSETFNRICETIHEQQQHL
jgi:hypothetical protein